MKTRHFGWKPSPPDFRDHRYAANVRTLETLPTSFDMTTGYLKKPVEKAWDQGNLGSCGPHTAAAALAFLQLFQGMKALMPDRLFIYYWTRFLMGTVNQDSGVYNRDLLKALNKYGWCQEKSYDITQFKKKPAQTAIDEAATRKIVGYEAVPQSLQVMKACIADRKPIIFGFSVYSSMLTSVVESTGNVPMPSQRELLQGGHDVLLVGYDDATQRFKFLNSWGTWGSNGYGTIPYAYATDPYLSGDFWTIKETPGGEPDVPPPTPSDITITLSRDLKAGTYILTPKVS